MNRDSLNTVDHEAQLDQHLQRRCVTNLGTVRQAAVAWSHAVWSVTESTGPLILTTSEIEQAFAAARRQVFVFGALLWVGSGHPATTSKPGRSISDRD